MSYDDFQALVSIHAPTQGATAYLPRIRPVYGVSIHAPTQGATPISAKNSSSFSAEIDKLIFNYSILKNH